MLTVTWLTSLQHFIVHRILRPQTTQQSQLVAMSEFVQRSEKQTTITITATTTTITRISSQKQRQRQHSSDRQQLQQLQPKQQQQPQQNTQIYSRTRVISLGNLETCLSAPTLGGNTGPLAAQYTQKRMFRSNYDVFQSLTSLTQSTDQ